MYRRPKATALLRRADHDVSHRSGPLRQLEDVEWVTSEWVDWCNARRLHSTSATSHPRNSGPSIILTSKLDRTRCWHPNRSGKEPGTVTSWPQLLASGAVNGLWHRYAPTVPYGQRVLLH